MSNPMIKQRGFTMLELFSVVVVSGVLAMAGMPLIKDYQRSHTAAGTQQKFAESLAVARERAVGAATTVHVCASADGATCSSDWDSGWLVYQSAQKKRPGESVPAEEIIQHTEIAESDAEFKVLDENLTSVAEIRFDSRGFNTASQRLMAMSCQPGAMAGGDAVIVERSGRVRIGKLSSEQENPSFRCQV
jgi:prepilin-type N-terminal cleavage/methylation domain-containing protein